MNEMNFEIARHNMVEQQIRPWNVLDQQSLAILLDIPREEFVPEEFKKLAFSDMQIPLAHGQFMLEPKIEAQILQAVQIKDSDHVFEVGTGSGFLTAVLAKKAKHITSIEIHSELAEMARKNLEPYHFSNVRLETGDGINDYASSHHFDVIICSGALKQIPEKYKEMLNAGGRMFVVTGSDSAMEARLITRVSKDQWSDVVLFETEIDYLINEKCEQPFVF